MLTDVGPMTSNVLHAAAKSKFAVIQTKRMPDRPVTYENMSRSAKAGARRYW